METSELFKKLEPKDSVNPKLKDEVFGSIEFVKMVLRLSDHFTSLFGRSMVDVMSNVFKQNKNDLQN